MVNKYYFRRFYEERLSQSTPLDPTLVLRELYCSVVMKREFSNPAKVSAFKSVFVPILTCSHES